MSSVTLYWEGEKGYPNYKTRSFSYKRFLERGLIIHIEIYSLARKCDWNNNEMFRISIYLQRHIWPKLSMAIQQCVCLYNNLRFGYKKVVRNITKHKWKGIKLHVDANFYSAGSQKTPTIQKRFCHLWDTFLFGNGILKSKKEKHTKTINCALLHMQTPSMLQQMPRISHCTNQTNFLGWKFIPAISRKKPSTPGWNPKWDEQVLLGQECAANKRADKNKTLFKIYIVNIWIN